MQCSELLRLFFGYIYVCYIKKWQHIPQDSRYFIKCAYVLKYLEITYIIGTNFIVKRAYEELNEVFVLIQVHAIKGRKSNNDHFLGVLI